MPQTQHAASVVVMRPAEQLYDMVSDITRMGEWSPTCTACWWDEGDGPWPGGRFTGRNQTSERTWETRSQVITADRPREFAYVVGDGWVRWGYTFTPAGSGGTLLIESWEFLPAGLAGFRARYGDDAEAQIAERTAAAHAGIPVTLAAIKQAAEAG